MTDQTDSDQTRLADTLSQIYEVLEDASEEAETQRENAVIGLLFVLTDYSRDVALQREFPTPNQKLYAAVGGEVPEKPADPGFWPDYAGDHEDFSMLVDWTDPDGPRQHTDDEPEIRTDGGTDQDHIYVGRIPGMYRWSTDYDLIVEWAGGEENVSIMHKRGREYVADYSERPDAIENQWASMNRRYDCGHVAYGPPRLLPSECPECKRVATDGGTKMTLEDAAEPAIVGDCAGCGGRMIEFFAAVSDGVRRVQLRCQECDAEAELRHDFEDGLEGGTWSGLKDPEFKDVAWVDCERCHGHGEIEDPICDLRRAMNGREHPCPKCQATGSVPRIVETDGGSDRRWCDGCEDETPHRQVGDSSAPGPTYECLACPERMEIEAALETDGGEDVHELENSIDQALRGDVASADDVEEAFQTDGGSVEDPSLEDALGGLMAAANYADDVGLEELSRRAADLYQDLGEQAPDEDWDADIEEVDPDA